jgi:hypothetical protein
MRNVLRVACCGAALIGIALAGLSASAYDINPLKNRRHVGDGRLAGRFFDTVHEDITQLADGCARNPSNQAWTDDRTLCPFSGSLPVGPEPNFENALVRGVWWNDDPEQLLNSVHYATWAIRQRHARSVASVDRDRSGQPPTIDARYRMQYRSHYGDLQFLHAMANANGDSAADVQRRILQWAQFAYAVAMAEIPPETKLADIDQPIIRSAFATRPGWSVGYLFAPKYVLRDRPESVTGRRPIASIALGSILHLIQDSYSAPHAKRVYAASEECRSGRVVQFHSYIGQDPDLHGPHDTRASLERNRQFTERQNPIEASARLIWFANRRADWTRVVEPYLRQQVFCVGPDAELSSAGDFR